MPPEHSTADCKQTVKYRQGSLVFLNGSAFPASISNSALSSRKNKQIQEGETSETPPERAEQVWTGRRGRFRNTRGEWQIRRGPLQFREVPAVESQRAGRSLDRTINRSSREEFLHWCKSTVLIVLEWSWYRTWIRNTRPQRSRIAADRLINTQFNKTSKWRKNMFYSASQAD